MLYTKLAEAIEVESGDHVRPVISSSWSLYSYNYIKLFIYN